MLTMIPAWLCVIIYIYGAAVGTKRAMFGTQILILFGSDVGHNILAAFTLPSSQPISYDTQWNHALPIFASGRDNINVKPVARWVLHPTLTCARVLYISILYIYLQTKVARVPGTNDTVAVASVLHGRLLQSSMIVKTITYLSDVSGTLFVTPRDRQQGLRNLKYVVSSFCRFLITGGIYVAISPLVLSLPLLVITINIFLVLDFTMLLMNLLSLALWADNETEVMLGFQTRIDFATFIFIQASIAVLAPLTINYDNTLALTVVLASPITLSTTLAAFFLTEPRLSYLAADVPLPSSSQQDVWCTTCLSTIFRTRKKHSKLQFYTHHRSNASLQVSISRKCRICTALWRHRTSIPKTFLGVLMFWKPVTTFTWNGDDLWVRSEQCTNLSRSTCIFRIIDKEEAKPWDHMPYMYTKSRPKDFQAPLGCAAIDSAPLESYTGSERTLSLTKWWLNDCITNHGQCGKTRKILSSTSFRPTRLLYIPEDYENTSIKISIISPHDDHTVSCYTTMSHCWGKKEILRLTSQNVDELVRDGIPFMQLPRSFQDAVRISHSLGVERLWIDSLCIIQDSVEDWARESRLMCDIYLNSICNLAATDACDSTEGLLSVRDPTIMRLEQVPDSDKYLGNTTDFFPNHILYERAWVFQESFLSQRTLDFTQGQVYWRCFQLAASEVYPRGSWAGGEINPAGRQHWYRDNERILSVSLIPDILAELVEWGRPEHEKSEYRRLHEKYRRRDYESFRLWSRIVTRYTRTKLTRPTDRVVAISGVAKSLETLYGEYAAGAWRNHMPFELLWYSELQTREVHSHRAPTWSWLSLEAPISYGYCDTTFRGKDAKALATFLDLDVQDLSGTSGELFLQGTIELGAIILKATWSGSWHNDGDFKIETIQGRRKRLHIGPLPFLSQGYGKLFFDDVRNFPPTNILCVPVAEVTPVYDVKKILGLVLERVGPSTYKRLGLFESKAQDLADYVNDGMRELVVIV